MNSMKDNISLPTLKNIPITDSMIKEIWRERRNFFENRLADYDVVRFPQNRSVNDESDENVAKPPTRIELELIVKKIEKQPNLEKSNRVRTTRNEILKNVGRWMLVPVLEWVSLTLIDIFTRLPSAIVIQIKNLNEFVQFIP